LEHRVKESGQEYEYLVRWRKNDEKDSWEPDENFDDMKVIKRYWRQHKANKIVLPKRRGPRRYYLTPS
jgi:hypothetical protein